MSFVRIETGLSCEIGCGDGTRAICLFVRVIVQQFSYVSEHKKSSQRQLRLIYLAPRRVHFARPCTQASKPALTDSNLAGQEAGGGA